MMNDFLSVEAMGRRIVDNFEAIAGFTSGVCALGSLDSLCKGDYAAGAAGAVLSGLCFWGARYGERLREYISDPDV